jgi:transposase
MHKSSTKLLVIHLHKEGRSTRYLADKFCVHHSTIQAWIADEKKVHMEVDSKLTKLFLGIYITGKKEWNKE